MKKKIVIVGGSAGAMIASEIFSNIYEEVLFLETYSIKVKKEKIIGGKIAEGLRLLENNEVDYFIATGDNKQRKVNFEVIYEATKKNPVNCIHPTSYISPSAKLGYGNLVCPKAVVHTGAMIGNNTIINTSSVIEHDCTVNDYAQISPNATLSGYVEVGESAFISSGSVVIPKIKIGKGCLIAAGSVVIKDTEENKLYAGVPAVIKKNL